jgi:ATP-dependent DNA helicase RecQ
MAEEKPVDADTTKRYKKYKESLKKYFGFDEFRENQIEIIDQVCHYKQNVVAILPTGAGKSLLYQLSAMILNKPVICVSPLISLMADQKAHMDELDIPCIDYNSTQKDKLKIKSDILKGEYKIIFLTPEYMIKAEDFLELLNKKIGIGAFAIDEAHCISSQGHNFRAAYRQLDCIKDNFPDIPILALTGTATKIVQNDMVAELALKRPKIFRQSHDRINLTYYINKKTTIENDLKKLLVDKEFIIIYCQTRKKTEKVSEFVESLGIKCDSYHAGLSDDNRTKIQNKFMTGELTCIVCTLSFGMGIDKGNVRKVIHYGAPKDLESYCQEVGRAGRDGKHSNCYLFYNDQDFVINRLLIDHGENYEHKIHKYNLLDTFIKFLKITTCKRKFILDYFNDISDNKIEECCDICINKEANKGKKINTVDVSDDCCMIIKLVKALPTKSGTAMIINMLRGSNNKKITTYMKTLYGYGEGKKYSPDQWKVIIDHLINCKLLIQKTITGRFRFTVIDVSPKGVEFLNSDETININKELLDIKVIEKPKKKLEVKKKTKKNTGLAEKELSSDSESSEDEKKDVIKTCKCSAKKCKCIKINSSSESESSDDEKKDVVKTCKCTKLCKCIVKPNYINQTLKLFNDNKSLGEIAKKLDKDVKIIESYLCDIVKNKKEIDFKKINLSYKIFSSIKDVIDYEFEGNMNNIAEIKEKCLKDTTYYQIKMTIAIIESKQIKKLEEIPKISKKSSSNKSSSDSDDVKIKKKIIKKKKVSSSESSE